MEMVARVRKTAPGRRRSAWYGSVTKSKTGDVPERRRGTERGGRAMSGWSERNWRRSSGARALAVGAAFAVVGCGVDGLSDLERVDASIRITVATKEGNVPIAGALVELEQFELGEWRFRDSEVTGDVGEVLFGPDVVGEADPELDAGTFRAKASATGFVSQQSPPLIPTFDEPDVEWHFKLESE